MNDMPRWLKLTIACALLEAKSIQLHADSRDIPLNTREDYDRVEAVWQESERIMARAKRARGRATIEAFRAGVIGEDWRRVWKPLAFSHPMFKKHLSPYAEVDLAALRREWRAELARIAQFGPQQVDRDPRPMKWRTIGTPKEWDVIKMPDGVIIRFGEGAQA